MNKIKVKKSQEVLENNFTQMLTIYCFSPEYYLNYRYGESIKEHWGEVVKKKIQN